MTVLYWFISLSPLLIAEKILKILSTKEFGESVILTVQKNVELVLKSRINQHSTAKYCIIFHHTRSESYRKCSYNLFQKRKVTLSCPEFAVDYIWFNLILDLWTVINLNSKETVTYCLHVQTFILQTDLKASLWIPQSIEFWSNSISHFDQSFPKKTHCFTNLYFSYWFFFWTI